MTVAELKEKLEEYPDDYEVIMLVQDNTNGVDVVREGSLWNIILE